LETRYATLLMLVLVLVLVLVLMISCVWCSIVLCVLFYEKKSSLF
jgi:hypothetical protein